MTIAPEHPQFDPREMSDAMWKTPILRRELCASLAKLRFNLEEIIRASEEGFDDCNMIVASGILEAIISALPPEARNKIGERRRMDSFKVDQEQISYFKERVSKMDEAMAECLGKELDQMAGAAAQEKTEAEAPKTGNAESMAAGQTTYDGKPSSAWRGVEIWEASRVAAGGMLALALWEMPYDFYKVLRFVVLAAGIIEIFKVQRSDFSQGKKTAWTVVFSAIAIMFNPLAPLAMARESWAFFNIATLLVFGIVFSGGVLDYNRRTRFKPLLGRTVFFGGAALWFFLAGAAAQDGDADLVNLAGVVCLVASFFGMIALVYDAREKAAALEGGPEPSMPVPVSKSQMIRDGLRQLAEGFEDARYLVGVAAKGLFEMYLKHRKVLVSAINNEHVNKNELNAAAREITPLTVVLEDGPPLENLDDFYTKKGKAEYVVYRYFYAIAAMELLAPDKLSKAIGRIKNLIESSGGKNDRLEELQSRARTEGQKVTARTVIELRIKLARDCSTADDLFAWVMVPAIKFNSAFLFGNRAKELSYQCDAVLWELAAFQLFRTDAYMFAHHANLRSYVNSLMREAVTIFSKALGKSPEALGAILNDRMKMYGALLCEGQDLPPYHIALASAMADTKTHGSPRLASEQLLSDTELFDLFPLQQSLLDWDNAFLEVLTEVVNRFADCVQEEK